MSLHPVPQLAHHMRSAVTTYGHDRLELEWRIGHRQGTFRPGVPPDAWRRLQAALDASPAFQKSHTETCERMGDAPGMKCIVSTTGATPDVWMHKKRLADVDVDPAPSSSPGAAQTGLGNPWSVRASLSLEEVEDGQQAPSSHASLAFKYERRKQRWSYRYLCWSIDMTQVRSNLPSHLDADHDAFEVEIELVDQGMLFERTVEHLVGWGWRMADELCAIMSGQGVQAALVGSGTGTRKL